MIFPNDVGLKKPSESFSIISALRNLEMFGSLLDGGRNFASN
jgi:hypothetical protein